MRLFTNVACANALLKFGDVKVTFGIFFNVLFKDFPICYVASPFF